MAAKERIALMIAATIVVAACSAAQPPPASSSVSGPAGAGASGAAAGVGAPAAQPLDAAIQDLSRNLISQNTSTPFSYQQRDMVPVASKISLSQIAPDGTITVTGAPGAIPAATQRTPQHNVVEVTSLDTFTGACAPWAPDGSFTVRTRTAPGATLVVTARSPDTCTAQGPATSAGAVLRVPDGTTPGPTMPFRTSGNNGEFRWTASGELLGPGAFVEIRSDDAPPRNCLLPRLHVYRLFDAQGEYVSHVNVNVSGPALTPTGLAIETDKGADQYWSLFAPDPGEQCLRGTGRYDISGWTKGLEPGWYRARIAWYQPTPNGVWKWNSSPENPGGHALEQQAAYNKGIEDEIGTSFLPLANVGNAAAPIVPAVLFDDTASWGAGGVRAATAKEDEGRFAYGSRIAFPAPYIASPRDPLSGRRVKYLLEPFFPTVAYSAFNFVTPMPLYTLDERAPGRLSVSVTKPDGKTTDVAKDAPIVQQFIAGVAGLSYQVETPFSGPGRTFGVTTGQPGLLVDLDQYGKHIITLSGSLRTAWGQDMRIRGTYEVIVAEPLELTLGTFQGMPLEVGAELDPTVLVRPHVPADVRMTVDFYPNGDPAKKQPFETSGKANRAGYFAPKDVWKAPSPGEYITRVTASWTDTNGVLWMGSRTGASIVATPSSPLIAHGERNSMLALLANDRQLRTWFFTRAFDPACGEAACTPIVKIPARGPGQYPFFIGDVMWMNDGSPIDPSITLEDPTGILAKLAPQVASDFSYCNLNPCVQAPDSKKLNSHTSAGLGAQARPNAVDNWAYWYNSAIHADGVNIHNVVSEFHSTHSRWYGHDTFGCQIGLSCYRAWDDARTQSDRQGDEEGDMKVLLGGAVVKSAAGTQFVPYASMSAIVQEALVTSPPGVNPPTYDLRDKKGNRICPPYQGAAGGIGTCGPLTTIDGLAYDLFVTPTGTRPGEVLEVGDTFVFAGLAWPTLDVAYAVTVTSPSGKEQRFSGRASSVGHIDARDKRMTVSEPGVWTVHVSATQDRPVPSTGTVPTPAIVADGKTKLPGYDAPLSAILGSKDSTYRFVVAALKDDLAVTTEETLRQATNGPQRVPSALTMTVAVPAGATDVRVIVGKPGLILRDAAVAASGPVRVELDADKLYAEGYTNIVLGASSLDVTVVGKAADGWFARVVNLRGMTPLGGARATIR